MGIQRLRVLNVLDPETYADAHIKGSINVPLNEIKDFAAHTDKNTPLVVYCAHYQCDASAKAWHTLHELGFQSVRVYEGGMNEWYHQGLPTEGHAKINYLKDAIAQKDDESNNVIEIDIHDLKACMEKDGLL